jgi:hypothetical protein
MNSFDIRSNIRQDVLLNTTVATDTDTNSSSLDLKGYQSGHMLSLCLATFTDGVYHISKLQESDDDSVWSDVDSDSYIGAIPTSDLTAVTGEERLETIAVRQPTKRYLRAVITSTGVTTGADVVVISARQGDILPVVEVTA